MIAVVPIEENRSLTNPRLEPHDGPRGGYRGRGRGARGPFYRGAMRGGPPRTSMKLDNRPKKLVIKGAPQEALQSVRDWYEVRVAFMWLCRVIV